MRTQLWKSEYKKVTIIHFREREAEAQRDSGLLKFIHLVTESTIVSKSPDSKIKDFLLYSLIQITKQDYAKKHKVDPKDYISYDSGMANF